MAFKNIPKVSNLTLHRNFKTDGRPADCDLKNAINNPLNLNMKELKMAEAKGLMKPVKMKKELAELLGATELPRTEITKKLWDYIKANKLQTKTENGKPENAGKFIVADANLLTIFKNTKTKTLSSRQKAFNP